MKNSNLGKIARYQIIFILLILALAVALVLSINTGSVNMSVNEIVKIIVLKAQEGSVNSNIIWKIRLPRLLAAAILGGALSVSGFLLQTFFRNPIAGPYVLGISSGAKMFVGFTMIVLMNYVSALPATVVVLAAFIGSLISMGFVMAAARKVSDMSMLLLVGVMIGYICSAITDFFINFAQEKEIANLTNWSMGSFSGIGWSDIQVMTVVVFISLFVVMMLSKPIGAYQLGEGYAQSMGINIKLFRLLLVLFSSLLSATVTAFAGPIAFVGIAVPQIAKILMNTSKPIIIIPATFLTGAVFCVFCDLLARTMFAPTELSIGTVTAFFGAPFVIWLLLKKKK
ncbi:iron chelate uptake ABC transporter family permease subunit [Acetobacterium paludosum]|uniref:Iron chelate uptake ABC transporter family permease subunit n=1 Tax=Acetobacterium paludosum TaxID=52693 RepID=A0A923HSI7_9FIRM|nr:iron ABC transporter permease [Acetobacterium paludosum]MBC3887894.1 iron chelate uptake ABC transporter family permease subunit [Acetobacterium paludosum]